MESKVVACQASLSRFPCHAERSEESARGPREILRCAQNDNVQYCHSERSEESSWTYG